MSRQHLSGNLRLGYLVPEFPGQTHSFFWRELAVLRQLDLSPDVVSTRRPAGRFAGQDWAKTAQALTTYLAPVSISAVITTLGELLRMPPRHLAELIHVAGAAASAGAQPEGAGSRFRAVSTQIGWVLMGARLASVAREREWAHIHVHSCGNSAYIAMYANLIRGLPYSLTLHGPLSDYGDNQRLKWKRAAFGIVITEGLQREIRASLKSALPGVIEVTPMGVDVQEFSRDEPYMPWSDEGPFRVFSCGRLNPSKGHDVLLGAVATMVRSGADVQLTIAGEDDSGGTGYRQDLERLTTALGISDRVQLLGAVSARSVRSELSRAHVFALASHAEPLGVAIMEAMSMGVPVVSTKAGGVAELVEDGVSGLLVEPGSPDLLAEAVRRVMQGPTLSRNLSEAGHRRVEASFNYRKSGEVLARLVRASNAGLDSHEAFWRQVDNAPLVTRRRP
jgi:glycosyltransferase involved in cell wall biosynthesis